MIRKICFGAILAALACLLSSSKTRAFYSASSANFTTTIQVSGTMSPVETQVTSIEPEKAAEKPVLPTSIGDAFVYPNPFRPAQGASAINFTNMPEGATIDIYTVTGELVRKLSADNAGKCAWDARNGSGAAVASEVYLAVVKNGSEKRILKVAVIR